MWNTYFESVEDDNRVRLIIAFFIAAKNIRVRSESVGDFWGQLIEKAVSGSNPLRAQNVVMDHYTWITLINLPLATKRDNYWVF